MLNYYDWQDHFLLVGITIRGGSTIGYLLDHVTQEQFFETYAPDNAVETGIREINGCNVTMLSGDSFDNLRRLYPATRLLVGED